MVMVPDEQPKTTNRDVVQIRKTRTGREVSCQFERTKQRAATALHCTALYDAESRESEDVLAVADRDRLAQPRGDLLEFFSVDHFFREPVE